MSVDGSDEARQTLPSQYLDQGNQNNHHSVFGGVFDLLISLDYGLNTPTQEITERETTSTEVGNSASDKVETPEELSTKTHSVEKKEFIKYDPVKTSECVESVKDVTAQILDGRKPIRKEISDILNNTAPSESLKNKFTQLVNKVETIKKNLTSVSKNKDKSQIDPTQKSHDGETKKDCTLTNKETLRNDSTELLDCEIKSTKEDLEYILDHKENVEHENKSIFQHDKDSLLFKEENDPETILPDDPKYLLESLRSQEAQLDLFHGFKDIIVFDVLDPSRLPLKCNKSEDTDTVLQGSSEGESILGGYGESNVEYNTQIVNDLSNKASNASSKKVQEDDLDLDMGCYSDASDEDVRNVTPTNIQAPCMDSNPSTRDQDDEPKNDSDSGCDVRTERTCNQVFPKDDSRVLQVSLRRLEEEEWFGSSKIDDSSGIGNLTDCNLENINGPDKHLNLNNLKMKTLKHKKHRRRLWAKKTKLYRCPTCRKMFLHKVLLDKHNKEIKCVRMWKCNQCVGQFSSKERLQEHTLSKCDTVKVFQCDFCDKKYVFKKHLIDHMTPVCKSSIENKCETCGLTFKSISYLNRHKKIHDKPEFLCEICGKIVVTAHRKTFESHLLTHSPEGTFTCAECNRSFESLCVLKKHLPEHGMIVFSEDFTYHCRFCGKPFVKSECLKEHLAIHTGETPFDCTNCGKKFTKRRNLRAHSKICHKVKLKLDNISEIFDEKPEICPKCFRAFDNPESYRDHLCTGDFFDFQSGIIKVENDVDPPPIFEDEKPYVCDACGSAIEGLENIINHVETCSKSSVTKQECGNNQVTKTQVLNIRAKCGKSFTTNWSRQRHSKTCSLCQRLQQVIEDKDSKPHACQECFSAFSSSEDLKRHLKCCKVQNIVGEIKQISVKEENIQQVCQKCGDQFSSHANWKRHFKFCNLKPVINKSPLRQKMCVKCGKMFNSKYISRHIKICVKAVKVKPESSFEQTQVVQSNSSSPQQPSGEICPKCGQFVKYSCNIYRHKKNCKGTLTKPPATIVDIKDESTLSSHETEDCLDKIDEKDLDRLVKLFDSRCFISTDSIVEPLNFNENNTKTLLCEDLFNKSHVPSETNSLNFVEESDLNHTKTSLEMKSFDDVRQFEDLIQVGPSKDLVINEDVKSLTCKTCGKCFHLKRYLVKHLLLCKVKKYICSVCNFKFKSQENLKKHMVLHSKSYLDLTIPCDKCGKTFAHTKSLKRHQLNCKILPLNSANSVQNTLNSSVTQELSITDEPKIKLEESPIETSVQETCNICNRKLSTLRSLKRHLRTVHKDVYCTPGTDQSLSEESNSIGSNNTAKSNEDKSVEAFEPEKTSFLKAALINTIEKRAHNQTDSTVRKSIPVEASQPQICADCGKILYSDLSYKNHLEGNTCKLTLTCIVCKIVATSVNEFTNHMLSHGVRIEDKTLNCKTCGKLLEKRKRSIECHMLLHTGERPFKCDKCTKSFTRKDGLIRHSMVHTGILPFSCPLCPNSFMEKRGLRRHLQSVHKISEDQTASVSPQLLTSSTPPKSLNKSTEANIEIGESHLKSFFEEKPDIKDLLERNLEALENFEQEKLFTVQHEGQLVFYGSLNQSSPPAVQNYPNSDNCQSELVSAIDSISGLGCQPVETEMPIDQW